MAESRLNPKETAGWEDLEELGLMALLAGMVEERGRIKAAEALGVNYKTLADSIEGGRLSRRMRLALQRRVLEHQHAEALRRERRVEGLEQRVGEVIEDLRRLRQELTVALNGWGDNPGERLKDLGSRVDWLEGHWPGEGIIKPKAKGQRPGPRPSTGQGAARLHPEIVTNDPEPGEELVYGDAMSSIEEWRAARQALEQGRDGLARLRAEERMRELEIRLIVDHKLTLPPDKYPWDSLIRGEQVNWRMKTLARVRRERRWAELRWWLRRVLSLGVWRN